MLLVSKAIQTFFDGDYFINIYLTKISIGDIHVEIS